MCHDSLGSEWRGFVEMGECKLIPEYQRHNYEDYWKCVIGSTNLVPKQFQAQTGFPWIDAIMTQLREEGWIHHLSRHAVACFLTRGDLWISWEEGMKVKMQTILISLRYTCE